MKFLMPSFTFNILSRKCSDERKFGIESLQYYTVKCQRMEEIVGLVVRKSMFCHERFLDHSLSEIESHLNPSTFTGNWNYIH